MPHANPVRAEHVPLVARRCHPQGSAGVAMQRLSGEGLGWVPTCGNLAALGAFLLGVALNYKFTGGDDLGEPSWVLSVVFLHREESASWWNAVAILRGMVGQFAVEACLNHASFP